MIRKSEDKRTLPRPILREDDNIKVALKEIQLAFLRIRSVAGCYEQGKNI
jgi:hypothetical protein